MPIKIDRRKNYYKFVKPDLSSDFDYKFVYPKKGIVTCEDFDNDLTDLCSRGLHFTDIDNLHHVRGYGSLLLVLKLLPDSIVAVGDKKARTNKLEVIRMTSYDALRRQPNLKLQEYTLSYNNDIPRNLTVRNLYIKFRSRLLNFRSTKAQEVHLLGCNLKVSKLDASFVRFRECSVTELDYNADIVKLQNCRNVNDFLQGKTFIKELHIHDCIIPDLSHLTVEKLELNFCPSVVKRFLPKYETISQLQTEIL